MYFFFLPTLCVVVVEPNRRWWNREDG